MRTNADVTIYNKYITDRVETYQRVQISDVHWEQRHARNKTDNEDLAVVYIPLDRGTDYLKPRAWLVLANKSGNWTLQVGDVIVKGLVSDELVAGVKSLSDLKRSYDDALVITSVDTRDFGSSTLQHWMIGAK